MRKKTFGLGKWGRKLGDNKGIDFLRCLKTLSVCIKSRVYCIKRAIQTNRQKKKHEEKLRKLQENRKNTLL